MPRKIRAGERLVIASHNSGKVEEIEALLRPYDVTAIGAGALGLPEPPETGLTFEENSALKAHAAAKASGLVALADDSDAGVDHPWADPWHRGVHESRAGKRRARRSAL